ncbi:hypothetical protein V492_05240 [Pseudogymnoascus sp. VKM F-4246]|nr:hypothetical protein V492_05240 [Pseudogymnoascus sp. VKM F-4246]
MATAHQVSQHSSGNGNSTSGGANAKNEGSPQPTTQHKRVYQACIPCRKRKVKCDLGSVDNPNAPPCVRCRRESKDCYFSVTRRKQRLDENDIPIYDPDFVDRNARKRQYTSDSGSEPPEVRPVSSAGSRPLNPAYRHTPIQPPNVATSPTASASQYNSQSGREHRRAGSRQFGDSNVRYENPEAQSTMRKGIYGPHDALDLLYQAATDGSPPKRMRVNSNAADGPSTRDNQGFQQQQQQQQQYNTPRYTQTSNSRPMGPPSAAHNETRDTRGSVPVDNDTINRMNDPGYKTAIRAWGRFRFVRAGWFTPAEAIAYIEYYYRYLSPMTPISPPTFQSPSTHVTLLQEEPILTVTLLTIASRYLQIPGTGGQCRSHAIHEQLWTYLRGMIERCLWGQESFGGGFCGSGATDWELTSSTAPWRGMRKGSLRTLGTIESLMILTEWHPRGLHFPPQDATDELMLPLYDGPDNMSTDEDGNQRALNGVGGKRIESWLEPAWRSDRMCWMLLSTAMGLSYELGVFDQIDQLLEVGGDMARPEYDDEAYRHRAARIKKLLLIYVTQLAGRLGWTNMVPENLRTYDDLMRKRTSSTDGSTPNTNASLLASFNYIPDLELDDQIIHCWAGITTAMGAGNDKIFRSRKYTTDIITTGKYLDLLAEFQPILATWKRTFVSYPLPQYIRHILTIEYEYVRIYVNSLSLQAVVERCTNNAATTENRHPSFLNQIPLTLYGGFTTRDQEYVREVVDGSRNLLRTVVEGLLPGGFLKHAPVRTYFRIISGAMFLLKTFALGASKNDVEVSIGLMDRAVEALRDCVVDDVHLGTRFADLLHTLTTRLRNRFMHAPVSSEAGASDSQQATAGGPQGAENNEQWNGTGMPAFSDGGNEINISATAFDLGNNAFYGNGPYGSSDGNAQNPFGAPAVSEGGPAFGGSDWGNAGEMWYLPPGAAFFHNANADTSITQTSEGVNLGGVDLLDYMAMDSMDQYPGGIESLVGEYREYSR